MKKLLALLLLLPGLAIAGPYLAKYGEGRPFEFWLYNADGTLDVDEVDSGTEVTLICNGGTAAGGTEAVATNDFIDGGAGHSHYSIALTAAEMQCARIAVNIAATVIDGFLIETYGHASSQHPDLDIPALQADVTQLQDEQLSTFLNCEVNTLNFAGDADQFACILTDLAGGAVTQASGDLEGLRVTVTSGDQIREARFITGTTWDAGNSELQLQLSRALPATLADAVTVIIH